MAKRPISLLKKLAPLVAFLASAILPASASAAFWLDGPQSTFLTEGPVARSQLDIFYVTLWVTTGIFIVVGAVLAYATFKFRAKNKGDEEAEVPHQGHGNPFVEIGLIVGSVLLLVIIAVPTLRGIWYSYDVPADEQKDALTVTATGYQWWFRFEYPDIANDAKAPLVTGNELIIPAGRAVNINLRTVDVIHSFWVPKLAGKVDMIPNRGNHLWLKADHPGYYYGHCAEFCGDSHSIMRFRVIALAPAEFDAWVTHQKQVARTVDPKATAKLASLAINTDGWTRRTSYGKFDDDLFGNWQKMQHVDGGENAEQVTKGRQLFTQKTCAGCHTVRGHEGGGITGPDLTHIGSRTTIAAGMMDNTSENLKQWITHSGDIKPGNKMWNGGFVDASGKRLVTISDDEANALISYLQSLK